jgi:hypothetical protein
MEKINLKRSRVQCHYFLKIGDAVRNQNCKESLMYIINVAGELKEWRLTGQLKRLNKSDKTRIYP